MPAEHCLPTSNRPCSDSACHRSVGATDQLRDRRSLPVWWRLPMPSTFDASPRGRTAAELERLRRIRIMLFQGYPIARTERAAWPGHGSTLFDQLRLAVTGGWPVNSRRIECRHHCRRSARIAPTLVLRASARFTGFFTTAAASVSRSAGNATAMSASLISADGWAATMSRGASIDGGVGSVDGAMASGCSRAGRIASICPTAFRPDGVSIARFPSAGSRIERCDIGIDDVRAPGDGAADGPDIVEGCVATGRSPSRGKVERGASACDTPITPPR